jgi:hypothetical protein
MTPDGLDSIVDASDTSSMEPSASRSPLSLHALIAEAKRRARQRRLVVTVLLVALAAVAGLVLALSGGGAEPRGLSGVGNKSGASRSASQTSHYVIPHFTGGHNPHFKIGNASCEISWNRLQSQAACVTALPNTLPASVAAVAQQRLLARRGPLWRCDSQSFQFVEETVRSVICSNSKQLPP